MNQNLNYYDGLFLWIDEGYFWIIIIIVKVKPV